MTHRQIALGITIAGLASVLVATRPAHASRCGEQNPPRCGLDSQTDPPDPLLGGTGGCTDASMVGLPMYRRTGACEPGDTAVIYDIGGPFPDNGVPFDQANVAGKEAFLTIRAGDSSPCAHMVDTIDPKPCPEPGLGCPNASDPQPEGAVKVPLHGYAIGCWTPPDHNGCRTMALYTKSVCLHAEHQLLGPGCVQKDGVDCPNVSVEQIAIDVPGTKARRVCPPPDPTNSCRATRGKVKPGNEGMKIWFGALCATNNCANPGTTPEVDSAKTCEVQWGATKPGYNIAPYHGINEPGWYDWKTGAFKLDSSRGKPTCGDLGVCLGERTGEDWDLRIVATPRPGQPIPCLGNPLCDAPDCSF
ncbi:MAG TPA: hypothetical protein VKA21_09190 [Candidatus Binatia bacterium]|nr:hypothetical protein [Candidatus Binatia bacterium]